MNEKQILSAIDAFLSRVTLTGKEVDVYNSIKEYLKNRYKELQLETENPSKTKKAGIFKK